MSLQSWKKEFYSPISKVSKKDALQHSLIKWVGLRKENLAKHGVEYDSTIGAITFKGSKLAIDGWSCALCRKYKSCDDCPLGDCAFEYGHFQRVSNPESMIDLIQSTVDKSSENK